MAVPTITTAYSTWQRLLSTWQCLLCPLPTWQCLLLTVHGSAYCLHGCAYCLSYMAAQMHDGQSPQRPTFYIVPWAPYKWQTFLPSLQHQDHTHKAHDTKWQWSGCDDLISVIIKDTELTANVILHPINCNYVMLMFPETPSPMAQIFQAFHLLISTWLNVTLSNEDELSCCKPFLALLFCKALFSPQCSRPSLECRMRLQTFRPTQ